MIEGNGPVVRPAVPQVRQQSGTKRVLAILGCFTAEQPSLTLSQISRRTGLPLTTTHRHVGELADWGALERDHAGRYHVGIRLWEVASLAPASLRLRDAALPFLEDLYEATHQNVLAAVLDGTEVVYVERIAGRDAVHVLSRPGSRMPLHASGVGLVLLAHSQPEFVDEVLAAPLRRYTDHTITDPVRLRRILANVRRDGYVISDRQIEPISVSVAAPVYDAANAVTAAISVVIPAHGTRASHYVPAVRAAARGISRSLGARLSSQPD
ncbi:MAG TPA: IclR family transcriptional regulator [Streptosporangiaceae bacterium]